MKYELYVHNLCMTKLQPFKPKRRIPQARTAPAAAPSVNFAALITFECVARHMSFVRAADEFEITATAISKTIKQLEAQLTTRLFNRTTRSVALTEAGSKLLASLAPALELIRKSLETATESSTGPHGTLKINTSYVAYAALIEPHVAQFAQRYPQITLEVSVDNNLSDIVSGGFDAGIRLGHALHRDVIATPIGPLQQLIVVASPAYLKRHGTPKTPEELLTHNCIRQRMNRSRFLEWEFRIGGKDKTIGVQGSLVFDEMRSTLSAARRGCGLAYVFRQFAESELANGSVVPLLEKYCPPSESFHLYYANRTHAPAKLRAFVEFMQAAHWKMPK